MGLSSQKQQNCHQGENLFHNPTLQSMTAMSWHAGKAWLRLSGVNGCRQLEKERLDQDTRLLPISLAFSITSACLTMSSILRVPTAAMCPLTSNRRNPNSLAR